MGAEYYKEWVCVFPGKMGIAWKLADSEVSTKEEAEKRAERNCNVVAVPLAFWEKYSEFSHRMVKAERDLQEAMVELEKAKKRLAEIDPFVPGVPLEKERIQEIRKREKRATSGPWEWSYERKRLVQADTNRRPILHSSTQLGYEGATGDEEFIAHSRQDIKNLLEHVEHLDDLIRDLGHDGPVGQYNSGYKKGCE